MSGSGYRNQEVAERFGRRVVDAGLVLAADHRDDSDLAGLLVPVSLDHPLWTRR
jgi:hypothetical protein